ncbi:MAG: peptidoglycan DD-metalloendopeptidase family protein [Desulfarculaceae bacterium]|nr:peptidoglycan DD-metalloendopeptidase family protein [Desulfarculaceae bacterium]
MLHFIKTADKVAAAIITAAVLCLTASPAAGEFNGYGVIHAWKLNVRSDASTEGDVVLVLEKGDRVEVLEKRGGIGGWLEIEYNGKTGYVRNRPKYVRLIKTEEPETEKPEETVHLKKKEKKIKRKIEKEQEKIVSFSEKETRIIQGLNEIDASLNKTRVRVSSLSDQIERIEDKIERIEKKKKGIEERLKQNRNYASTRLNAYYRMKMLGRLEITGPPDSLFDFIIKQKNMEKIVESDLEILNRQIRNIKELENLKSELDHSKENKLELEEELTRQVAIKKNQSIKKNAILKEIRRKKSLSKAAVASLEKAAERLERQMEKIRSRHLEQESADKFSRYKGSLSMPAKGEIISKFGTKTSGDYKSFTFQSGIDIRVERGEPVRSVFHGKVMFAEWFKGYGNLMIINHGENYYTLYAHLEEFFKTRGDMVEEGEVIATAGDTGSIKGLCLHFEVRFHGEPVNPLKWLNKGV